MTDGQGILEWLGLSGVAAGVAGAIGYGRLQGRLSALEERARQDTSQENQIAIARLEEQFKAMNADIQDIKRAVVK